MAKASAVKIVIEEEEEAPATKRKARPATKAKAKGKDAPKAAKAPKESAPKEKATPRPVSTRKIAGFLADHADALDLTSREDVADCGLFLADGTDVPCHAVADYGDRFIALTLEGKVMEVSEDDLA